MRKHFFFFLCGVFAAVLSACTSTTSTILEYDETGNLIKRTESSESVIKTVTDSTKNKSVIVWEDGWAAYISVSSGTAEDPTPHGKLFAGKVNKGAISILPDQTALPGIAKIIQATKSDISASLTEGITSMSSELSSTSASSKDSASSIREDK